MIDLRVYGEPAQCREKADDVRRVARKIAETADVVHSGSSRALSSWQGSAASGFSARADTLGRQADKLDAGLGQAARALDTFADELAVVIERMAQAREVAVSGGLTVSGDRVMDQVVAQLVGDTVPADVVQVRNHVQQLVYEARSKEQAAHEALRSALTEACPASLPEIRANAGGVVPVKGLAEGGYASMSVHGGLAGGSLVAEWSTKYKYGTFYADAVGKHAKAAPWFLKVLRGMESSNWQARPGQSVMYARWVKVGKVLPGLSAGLSGAAEAYQQWRLDEALRPGMETSEQVARAVTMGISTGGLSFLGEFLGATVGGVVGVWSGPGGAITAFVGGTAGGIAGAEAGEELGHETKGFVGDLTGSVTDSVTSFGDAVTFWD